MTSTNIRKVESLKKILIERATYYNTNRETEYVELRNELCLNPEIKPKLPHFVLNYRDIEEFWFFIKDYKTYDERRKYISNQFAELISFLEFDEGAKINSPDFSYQFPAGLPFGLKKPSLAVIPHQGSQKVSFQRNEPEIFVIQGDVYPDFSYQNLKDVIKSITQNDLIAINQTDYERNFFDSYITKYNMWDKNIPVLIPQVWIQWHSETKENLRTQGSSYVDDLYRVDFVAFWNNQRFAILVDDIGHYAKKNYNYWNANEEAYSMRLKEDRKLRKEGWQVFRVSNWELRQKGAIDEILSDLQEYMEF